MTGSQLAPTLTQTPSKPSIAPRMASILAPGWTAIREENGRTRFVVKPDWAPARALSEEERAEFTRFTKAAERWLRPVDQNWLGARLAVLFAHFPLKDVPSSVLTAVASDWLTSLSEFPQAAIDEAIRDWLNESRWRPTIADIRLACEDIVARTRRDLTVARAALMAGSADPKTEGK